MTNVSIKDWINFNPRVGTEAMHMIGYPGSGKSNMATGLMQKCLQKGEYLVMPGDRFCEWRHFIYHPKFPTRMTAIVPKGLEIFYYPDKEKVQQLGEWIEVDYDELDIFDYITDKRRLLVIYDQHLRLASRCELWVRILEQLVNRIKFVETAVGLLFHEAGILFPQSATGKHWGHVNKFSELFVETRKGLVRTVLVSQIETEIESTIRGKCLYACIRKSYLSKSWARLVRKVAPFTALNEFQLVIGRGLYQLDNTIDCFFEKKLILKMIPVQLIDEGTGKRDHQKKKSLESLECDNCHHEWIPKTSNPLSCPKCKGYFGYKKKGATV